MKKKKKVKGFSSVALYLASFLFLFFSHLITSSLLFFLLIYNNNNNHMRFFIIIVSQSCLLHASAICNCITVTGCYPRHARRHESHRCVLVHFYSCIPQRMGCVPFRRTLKLTQPRMEGATFLC